MANCNSCGYPVDKHPLIDGQLHCINGRTPPNINFNQLAFQIKYKNTAGVETIFNLTGDVMKMSKRMYDLIAEGAAKVVVTWVK